jgi:hypothetical protein
MSAGHIEQPGKGVLFMNEKKVKDNHPDWKGFVIATKTYNPGDKIKMTAWTKQTARGQLISLAEDTWVPDPNWVPPQPISGKPNMVTKNYPKEVNNLDDDSVPF